MALREKETTLEWKTNVKQLMLQENNNETEPRHQNTLFQGTNHTRSGHIS